MQNTTAEPGKTDTTWLAIGAMIAATLCYLLGDTLVKLAAVTVPVPQIIVMRGAIAALLISGAAAAAGAFAGWQRAINGRVLLRGMCDAASTLMFTHALVHLRIADATAIINAVPIAATLLAVLVLREQVGVRRWSAILVGFAGVLLVIRPEAGEFSPYSLLAVGAMLMISAREVVTRGIPPAIPSLLVTLWSALAVGLAGGAASIVSPGWVAVSATEILLIAGAALFLFGAYHFSVVAVRHGEVSLVGPFRYTIIIWGLLVGFLVWGDVPDLISLAGMSLIVVAGITVLRRRNRSSVRSA